MPLSTACLHGQIETVWRLIAHGADVNLLDAYSDDTALHHAVGGSPACVRALLAAGAAVDLVDKKGDTPLLRAVLFNDVESAKLLYAHGADPNHQNAKGETAKSLAGQLSDPCRLELLRLFENQSPGRVGIIVTS